MFDVDETKAISSFEKLINSYFKNIDKSKLKKTKPFMWLFIGLLITGLIVLVFAQTFFQYNFIIYFVFIAFIIASVVCLAIYRKNSRNNQKIYLEYLPTDIYKRLFDEAFELHNIELLGVFNASTNSSKYFEFKASNEIIKWYTKDDYRTVETDNKIKTYYWYEWELQVQWLSNPGLDDFSFAYTNKNKNKGPFISESMEFNEKYTIDSKNQFQMTKLFRPSVIQGLLDLQPTNSDRHLFKYSQGYFISNYVSPEYSSKQNFELNKLTPFFTKSISMTAKKISEKIYHDFYSFFNVLKFIYELRFLDFTVTLK